jgi:hypothetical protein
MTQKWNRWIMQTALSKDINRKGLLKGSPDIHPRKVGTAQCNYIGICTTMSLNPTKHTEIWSYYPGKQENPGSDAVPEK